MSIRVFAPAKINLTLEVAPARGDGRHPLQSAVMFADVGDWIEAAPAAALSLSVRGPMAKQLADEPDNLVLRAARALAEASGRAANAALVLEKHLPVASGVGGGSSDAAATLKALNALWRLGMSEAELARIGAPLGADIPACVAARTAYMTGAGETFAPMDAPALSAVLINPLTPLSTGEVYRKFDQLGLGGTFVSRAAPAWRDFSDAVAAIRSAGNALEAPAFALMPALAEIKASLSTDARAFLVAMSGSGATLFAITKNAADASGLADHIAQHWPHYWVRAARLG